MLDKTQRMNSLLDWYDSLLTANQKAIADMHFREDFSLSEIAEQTGSSRSAVYDTIQRVQKIMEDMEAKLQCVAKYETRTRLYQTLRDLKVEAVDEILDQLIENE